MNKLKESPPSKSEVENRLHRIANVLLLNASFINNIGLLNGKMGIAIFFYQYSKFSGNKIFSGYAGELIDEIYEEILQNSPVDYADGLAGLGPGIGYLVNKGFIEADIDEVLADLDKQLQHHTFHHAPLMLDVYFGITGIGNYFVSRLNNHSDAPETEIRALNKECLNKITGMLNLPYNSYKDILSVINLLSGAYPVMTDQPKVKMYLDYAIDKLETMVCEDVHFGVYPRTFNPLSVAVSLIQASEKSGNQCYIKRALHFLERYEDTFRQYLDNDFQNLSSGSLKWSLLYKYLGVKLKDNKYLQLSGEWLNLALVEDKESLAGFRVGNLNNTSAMGIIDGYAGVGLALLTLIEKCSMDWLNLIPVVLEKDRKSPVPDSIN